MIMRVRLVGGGSSLFDGSGRLLWLACVVVGGGGDKGMLMSQTHTWLVVISRTMKSRGEDLRRSSAVNGLDGGEWSDAVMPARTQASIFFFFCLLTSNSESNSELHCVFSSLEFRVRRGGMVCGVPHRTQDLSFFSCVLSLLKIFGNFARWLNYSQ